MKKITLLKLAFLLLIASQTQAQNLKSSTSPLGIDTEKTRSTKSNQGWFLVYRSTDGMDGNSLYFGDSLYDADTRITSPGRRADYGHPYGLNFITNRKLAMSIDSNTNTYVYGKLEATREPARIARLHIDPYGASDGFNGGGIFFGGVEGEYGTATTGIASSANGLYGSKNGLNFWVQNELAMAIDTKGRVGIGVDLNKMPDENDQYKLIVKGKVRATNIKIANMDKWPDYVFDKNYNLKSLSNLEKFVATNKHLPHFPSAKQIENDDNSIGLSEMIASLLRTVEEQALYIIDINKTVESMQQKLDALINNEQ